MEFAIEFTTEFTTEFSMEFTTGMIYDSIDRRGGISKRGICGIGPMNTMQTYA
jgi:hypothetical protein